MENLKKIKFILGNNNIYKLLLIILLNLFQTMLEIISLGLIIPIMSAIIEPDLTKGPKFISFLYEFFGTKNNIDFLKILLLILFSIYTLKLVLSIFFKYIHVKFQFSLVRFVTIKIIKKYLNIDYEHFLKNKSSKMISTVYNEGSSFIDWYISPLIVIISEVIFVASVLALLLYVDVVSTLVIVSMFLLFAIIFLLSTRSKIQKWGKDRQSLAENLLKNLSEIFDGIKVIKIFQKENFFLEVFSKNQKNMQSLLQKNDVVLFLPRVMLEYLVLISIMIVLLIAISSGSDLSNKIPIIALYAAAALKLIPSASKIMVSFQNLKFGAPTITRVYEEIRIENKFRENQIINNDFKSIKFENISYSYNNDQNIIEDTSITINKGEFIGIKGLSGSGKTTILNIILGLIAPKNGKIFVDEKNVTDSYSNFRNLFSLVSQDVFLFDGSVAKNVALEFDKKDIDENKLRNALSLSQLENFIKSAKNNLDTDVGEKGISISGGQKQRISIARALYRGSKILVLDEATSNLDLETEEKLIHSLSSLKGKKTIIYVTHRVSSLKLCDKIYTINQNKKLIQLEQ
tara:strand:- start:11241 stop:12959 length:1719 start_codon:yes stop_codon:yes gene_type:complete